MDSLLHNIKNPRSPTEHIASLRALKNEIVGHQQKKELWVQHGILETLTPLAAAMRVHADHSNIREQIQPVTTLSEKEMIRLQAVSIIGCLASGGPAFLLPLRSASTLPAILSNLCPATNPPRLVLAALRALYCVADAASLSEDSRHIGLDLIADAILSKPYVSYLNDILRNTTATSASKSQVAVTCVLISKVCLEEDHRNTIANSGTLGALATKLAVSVVFRGLVAPGAEVSTFAGNGRDIQPNLNNGDLARVLETIAAVIGTSKLRASLFVYSDAILDVFGIERRPPLSSSANWDMSPVSTVNDSQITSAVESLIPRVPLSETALSSSFTFGFPHLGEAHQSEPNAPTKGNPGADASKIRTSDKSGPLELVEPESLLIAYLFWLTRSTDRLERLMAASVLTSLYTSCLVPKSREPALGMLVVPLLVELLDDALWQEPRSNFNVALSLDNQIIRERAPAVLASLIADSGYLQSAAFDAGVVPRISKMFKSSFDMPSGTSENQFWTPMNQDDIYIRVPGQSSHLGAKGISAAFANKLSIRESTLAAITALVQFKDEYRKAFIDLDIVPRIVEALKPCPISTSDDTEASNILGNGSYGTTNPVPVLIAACGAVRHLSRSVSILRTTLIDNGIMMPVFDLLRHDNVEVQIAATSAVCNLVRDFSPMRNAISEAGILRILCEHAHSSNVNLRLNALWALKHLVHAAGNDVKKNCLEELGQQWLMQLICDDAEDEKDSARPNFTAEDTSMETLPEINMSSRFSSERYATLQDLELNLAKQAQKLYIAVQEQGLDFIRNLISGCNNVGISETSEMIDFVFKALGQEQIFDTLAAKLRPRFVNPFSKRNSLGGAESKVIPPQPEIIVSVAYILVHMAASVSRHRQIVISQTDLLCLLVPQFNNPNKEVRQALCWLVINLTWSEDAQEMQACAQRASELKRLGFLSRLEGLEHDFELDVRERAKTAVWQMRQCS